MATSRVFQDLISGVTDADPGTSGISLSGPFLADLAVVAAPEFIALTLDPEKVFGDAEIVHVTAHTASATTATIARGKEGTTGIAHAVGTKAIAAPTAAGVSELIPVGSITMYGGAAAPANYALCDGTSLDTTVHASLFAAIGYTYGGSGANFNVPNMKQRFPIHKADSGVASTLGGTGGAIDHTHTGPAHIHTMPTHTHTMPTHVHGHGTHFHTMPTHTHSQGNTGSTGAHQHTLIYEGTGVTETFHSATFSDSGLRHHDLTGNKDTESDGNHAHTNPTTGATDPGNTNSTDPGNTDATDPGDTNARDPGDTNSAGTGATGVNNPPFLVVNFIIKVV